MIAPSGVCVIQMSYSGSPAAIHDGMPLKYSTDRSNTCRPSTCAEDLRRQLGRHPVRAARSRRRAPTGSETPSRRRARAAPRRRGRGHRTSGPPAELAGSLQPATRTIPAWSGTTTPSTSAGSAPRSDRARSAPSPPPTSAAGPGYPDEAARWAVGRDTGTRPRPRRRHRQADAHAGGARLRDDRGRAGRRDARHDAATTSPSTRAFTGSAEVIPLLAHSVDAVVVAQAWHWFDHARAGGRGRRASCGPAATSRCCTTSATSAWPWVERFARATGERFGSASEPLEFDGVRGRPGSARSRTASSRTSSDSRSTTSSRSRGRSASWPCCRTTSGRRWSRRSRRSAGARADADGLVELPYRLFAARAVVGTG